MSFSSKSLRLHIVYVFLSRLVFAMSILWSIRPCMDLHEMTRIGFQLTHVVHHIVDHADSIERILQCLTHTDSDHASGSAHDHGSDQRHHDNTPYHHCGCTTSVCTVPDRVVYIASIHVEKILSSPEQTSVHPNVFMSAIFQPPRA